jgi:uncharacterized paraquat-inducible protein A
MIGGFCIVMPALKLISICVVWVINVEVDSLPKLISVYTGIGKWSMLDVFTMAYAVFLLCSETVSKAQKKNAICTA